VRATALALGVAGLAWWGAGLAVEAVGLDAYGMIARFGAVFGALGVLERASR